MKTQALIGVAMLSVVLAAAPAAAADMVIFTATGDVTATWVLPKAPTPSSSSSDYFFMNGVEVTINGVPTIADLRFRSFAFGGVDAYAFPFAELFTLYGQTLYTGDPGAPVFTLGDFDLGSDLVGGGPIGSVRLQIADVGTPGGIPEPANWALLVTGFGLVGSAMRRRAASRSLAA